MEEEVVISSEEIFKGKIVNLFVNTVIFKGMTLRRELIRHPGAVAVVAIDQEGNVLLVRQYRTGAGRRLLELPAGGLNPGEEPRPAAVRELQEEIGYYPDELVELGGFWVGASYNTEYITIYLCRELHPASLPGDEDEDIEVVRVPFADALAAARDGTYRDSKTIIGLNWADSYLNSRKQPG